MKTLFKTYLTGLLLAVPLISSAQVFEGLYDIDSTLNSGWDLLLKPDSSYFIVGFVQDPAGQLHLADMNVSANSSQELSNHIFRLGNTTAYTYEGNNGTAVQLSNGGYLLPLTLQSFPLTGGFLRSLAGLAKLDAQGDTVFVKFYTDTTVYFDGAYTCAVMPDGGYLLGASRNFNPDSSGFSEYDSLMLIRTDSNGNLLWSRKYKPDFPNRGTESSSLDILSNGKILVGATNDYVVTVNGNEYDHLNPWFMLLDSMGNILKDTVYGPLYVWGGGVFNDMSGGYYHYGALNEPIISNDVYDDIFSLIT